jgi:divalent metal cation (Fe/Co/Zn/Cd) transporter
LWRIIDKDVLVRALEGVEPQIVEELTHAAGHVSGVKEITEVRARWLGHQLLAELNIAVAPELPMADARKIASDVQARLPQHVPFLARPTVHVDAIGASGEKFHFHRAHEHEKPHSEQHEHRTTSF